MISYKKQLDNLERIESSKHIPSHDRPAWLEVPIGTELSQVTWERDIAKPKPDPNIFKIPSSDGKGFYQVQKVGVKWTCNCQGYWRSKDRICKHIKQVNK